MKVLLPKVVTRVRWLKVGKDSAQKPQDIDVSPQVVTITADNKGKEIVVR